MKFNKVVIFYNRKSGLGNSFMRIQQAFSKYWKDICKDISWYFPSSREESDYLLDIAIKSNADCIIAGGGDGTIASIAKNLIKTNIVLGAIPLGSGNGLARHFDESLDPEEAVKQLAKGIVKDVDIGYINDNPFIVSASIAWDAALVHTYNQFPIRGIGSYVMAGICSFLQYSPSNIKVETDSDTTESPPIDIEKPILLTIGNLSGWGGGALIDVNADSSDGILEMAVAHRKDTPILLAHLPDVFNTGLVNLPAVISKKFTHATITRTDEHPIQLDGELIDMGKVLDVCVKQNQLKLLVPKK